MLRMPAVADSFYPGDPVQLRKTLETNIPVIAPEKKIKAKAVIMPHAGYVYSGATAGVTIAKVKVPPTVIILGPSHTGRGASVALGTDDWQMPMGQVKINQELVSKIVLSSQLIQEDELAHLSEHSLEVQVPFLQYLREDIQIVPLVVSRLSYEHCIQIGGELAAAVSTCSSDVMFLASTDMSHFESRQQSRKKDQLAIDKILSFDPQGLYETVLENQISMCGILPTTITLIAAKILGATKVELVNYTDSGAVNGDTSQVVGYAGLIIS